MKDIYTSSGRLASSSAFYVCRLVWLALTLLRDTSFRHVSVLCSCEGLSIVGSSLLLVTNCYNLVVFTSCNDFGVLLSKNM